MLRQISFSSLSFDIFDYDYDYFNLNNPNDPIGPNRPSDSRLANEHEIKMTESENNPNNPHLTTTGTTDASIHDVNNPNSRGITTDSTKQTGSNPNNPSSGKPKKKSLGAVAMRFIMYLSSLSLSRFRCKPSKSCISTINALQHEE